MNPNRKHNYCTFYIVRHGETDWNAKKIVQGQKDLPLNKQGEVQAQDLAQELRAIKFDRVFSSDLIRAKHTAEIIALEHKIAVEVTQVLRERRFGEFEGKIVTELRKVDSILEALNDTARFSYKYSPDVESDEDLMKRALPLLREIAVAYPNKTILVVTHGGVMRALLGHLTGAHNPNRHINNTAYVQLESDGVDFFIKKLKGIK